MSWAHNVENRACLKDPGVRQLADTTSVLVAVNIVLGVLVFVVIPVVLCVNRFTLVCSKKDEEGVALRRLDRLAKDHHVLKRSNAEPRRLLQQRLESHHKNRTASTPTTGFSRRIMKARRYLYSAGSEKVSSIVDPNGAGFIHIKTLSQLFQELNLPVSQIVISNLPGMRSQDNGMKTTDFLNWIFAGNESGGVTIPPLPPRVKKKMRSKRNPQENAQRSHSANMKEDDTRLT